MSAEQTIFEALVELHRPTEGIPDDGPLVVVNAEREEIERWIPPTHGAR